VIGVIEAHTNGGRLESGVGVASGLALGNADALGVGLDPTPVPTEFAGRLSGLATNRTPITTAAMTAAATPAIQNGPFCSGTSASEDRTRSDSAALGAPVTSSKT
jgi:hypothetical protein